MEHTITLDRERKLKYGFKALRLLKQRFSIPIQDIMKNISVEDMPIFVWAGLIWGDPDLTVEKVEELLDEKVPDQYTLIQIMKIVFDALFDQVGIKKEDNLPFVEKTNSSPQPEESPSKSD